MYHYRCPHIELEIRAKCFVFCSNCKSEIFSEEEIYKEELKLNKKYITPKK
jgi:hypothetical protein